MKPKNLPFILFVLFNFNCRAQEIDSVIGRRILKLISSDSTKELSLMVEYPLKRENPLPDISCSDSFVSYYHILFDSAFKQELKRCDTAITLVLMQGNYGFPCGDITYNWEGKINHIGYRSSPTEAKLKEKLEAEIKSRIYLALKADFTNYIVCEAGKVMFRVDITDKGYRYASWQIGHEISEKPDLILYEGIYEKPGSGPWWDITFKNGDWKYIVGRGGRVGLELVVMYKDEVKGAYPCNEIK